MFEPLCIPPNSVTGLHVRDEIISSYGIVGARGVAAQNSQFYNHMSASSICDYLGENIFNAYFKWCVVRHPMDRQVSWWWFQMDAEKRAFYKAVPDFNVVQQAFASDLLAEKYLAPIDRNIYCIENKPVVDFFVRYENLINDLNKIAHKIGLNCLPGELGRYKSDSRVRPEKFKEYFKNIDCVELMRKRFAWEFEYFGYDF
jgi:hypothetical protein